MKTKIGFFIFIVLFGVQGWTANFNNFLKACGYGALIGAGVGVVTLVTENKPGSHYENVAKMASLGLYGGIAYGAYQMNAPAAPIMHHDIDLGATPVIVPKFSQARLDGIEISSNLLNF